MVKDAAVPLKTVADSSLVAAKVAAIPSIMTPVSISAPFSLDSDAKNIVIIPMSSGNLPLHGTREFVSMARSLSLRESIILHPTTADALHPSPMHMVRACLPHALHPLKHLSRLNATRGKNPQSSRRVNIGKKIAIGGSITETTQARTLYIPYTVISQNSAESPISASPLKKGSSRASSLLLRNSDG